MSKNPENRHMYIMGISLLIDIDDEGVETRKLVSRGFDSDGLCCDIEAFEIACKAARAAEAVWMNTPQSQPQPKA